MSDLEATSVALLVPDSVLFGLVVCLTVIKAKTRPVIEVSKLIIFDQNAKTGIMI